MQIRRAGIDDAAALARLCLPLHELHVQAHPEFFKPLTLTDEFVDHFRERLGDPHNVFYIGEVADEAVGYALAQIVARPENLYTYALNMVLLDQLSVHTTYQNQGYGRALVERVIELARERGIGHVALTVWAFNKRAIAFYERLGFRHRDLRLEFYID